MSEDDLGNLFPVVDVVENRALKTTMTLCSMTAYLISIVVVARSSSTPCRFSTAAGCMNEWR